jgi:hypothetical protein
MAVRRQADHLVQPITQRGMGNLSWLDYGAPALLTLEGKVKTESDLTTISTMSVNLFRLLIQPLI